MGELEISTFTANNSCRMVVLINTQLCDLEEVFSSLEEGGRVDVALERLGVYKRFGGELEESFRAGVGSGQWLLD